MANNNIKSQITLREYLYKRIFVVPNYQRGYIWGQRNGKTDSVTFLLNTLLTGFQNKSDVFLQGVTVYTGSTDDKEYDEEVTLIDGQQRTTFFYLLLKELKSEMFFDLRYEVRQESNNYIHNGYEDGDYQDIYFFKKTISIIREMTKDIEHNAFVNYILDNVKLLFIVIPKEQAISVFTMMNGSRAQMLQEELIKADMLRIASIPRNKIADEWDSCSLRSRYARTWDEWCHWWNCPEVRAWLKVNGEIPLSEMLPMFLGLNDNEKSTLDAFRTSCNGLINAKEAKDAFDKLRRLQKRFEDAFEDAAVFNMIGGIVRMPGIRQNKRKMLLHFFGSGKEKNIQDLKSYFRLSFLGMTHEQIIKWLSYGNMPQESISPEDRKIFDEPYTTTLTALNSNFLYLDNNGEKEYGFRYLFMLNIEMDSDHGRKFDFTIWDNGKRSLEHIYPKSKVLHIDENGVLVNGNDAPAEKQDDCIMRNSCILPEEEDSETSEHGIGNLVLLFKSENSEFGNRPFNIKKQIFFDPDATDPFNSLHLLHTVCIFAKESEWNGEKIARQKKNIIEKFIQKYECISYGE